MDCKENNLSSEEKIFWYFAGFITMVGIYTIAWLIETLLSLR